MRYKVTYSVGARTEIKDFDSHDTAYSYAIEQMSEVELQSRNDFRHYDFVYVNVTKTEIIWKNENGDSLRLEKK